MIESVVFDLKDVLFTCVDDNVLVPLFEGVALLNELAQFSVIPNLRLLSVSNIRSDSISFLHETYPDIVNCFEAIVHPDQAGARKPSPEIFEYLFRNYKINPETMVFIDDQRVNLESAQSLGATTLLWSDPCLVRKQLVHLGCLARGTDNKERI